MNKTIKVDCRGMQCPAPILSMAKTAKKIGNEPAILEVLADDCDFPKDAEAWCRTAKGEIFERVNHSGTHTFVIGLNNAKAPDTKSSKSTPERSVSANTPATVPVKKIEPVQGATVVKAAGASIDQTNGITIIDCVGMQCPAPILAIAKQTKTVGKAPALFKVKSDDVDFPKDFDAWSRTAKAQKFEQTKDSHGVVHTVFGINGAKLPSSKSNPKSQTTQTKKVVLQQKRSINATQQMPAIASPRPKPPATPSIPLKVNKPKPPSPGTTAVNHVDNTESTQNKAASLSRDSSDVQSSIDFNDGKSSIDETVSIIDANETTPADADGAVSVIDSSEFEVPVEPISSESLTLKTSKLDLRSLGSFERFKQLAIFAKQSPGSTVNILCEADGFAAELDAWCADTNVEISTVGRSGDCISAKLKIPETGVASNSVGLTIFGSSKAIAAPSETNQSQEKENRCTLLVLHNDFESLMAAMMVATSSAAQGMDVAVFFSFWGVNLLRSDKPRKIKEAGKVTLIQKMMKMMMPKGPKRQKLSQMHMGGMGKGMMELCMKRNNVMSLEQLMEAAIDQDIKFIVCSMSMGIMGIQKKDIIDKPNVEFAGVSSFVEASGRSRVSLVF